MKISLERNDASPAKESISPEVNGGIIGIILGNKAYHRDKKCYFGLAVKVLSGIFLIRLLMRNVYLFVAFTMLYATSVESAIERDDARWLDVLGDMTRLVLSYTPAFSCWKCCLKY